MTPDAPLRTRPLTPDEVLEGLRDLFVRGSGLPRERAVELIRFDTTFEALAPDDLGFSPEFIELYFGIDPLPVEWWQRVLEFGTVGGLCHALAQFVEVPVVEPVVVAGRPCRTSGAFLAVRALLAGAGADVSDLRPSTPLLPYVWVWPDVFRWDLPRLAPGRVPPVSFQNRTLTRRVLGTLIGFGGLLVALWVARGFPVLGGLLAGVFVKVFLLDLLRAPWAARRRNWSVEFGDLYDFRDLARVIAGEEAADRQAA